MKAKNFLHVVLLPLLLMVVAGCGNSDSAGTAAVSTLAASESCIGCHSTVTSRVTGARIVDEWLASAHNTRNGASCRDCHEPAAGHPNNCGTCHGGGATPAGTDEVVRNPDQQQKCLKCHGKTATVKPLGAPHFNNVTASYVSSQYVGNCRKCHNPHDPSTNIEANRQWAQSGHGDRKAKPWNNYDFKTRGAATPGATPANTTSQDCVRCHTATGYINYVSSNFTDIRPWGQAEYNAGNKTKQPLACNACHDDGIGNAYTFKTRAVPSITGYYNYSSKLTKKLLLSYQFPDLGTSNICMACHTAREIGDTVKTAASNGLNFTNAGFINSHYLTAGATIFRVSGYTFPGRTYENVFYQHDQIGRNNFLGTGSKGPCVTCHMSSPEKHHFLPVAKDDSGNVTAVTSAVCNGCHSQRPWTKDTLEERKLAFQAALDALKDQLAKRGIYFYEAHPYFYTATYNPAYLESKASPHCTSNLPVVNWQTGGNASVTPIFKVTGGKTIFNRCSSATNVPGTAGTGSHNMGAAFNYNLLKHDPGAFAHNSYYVKRLIYDSIDWLDDNQINHSVGITLNALPDTTPYKANAINYLLP